MEVVTSMTVRPATPVNNNLGEFIEFLGALPALRNVAWKGAARAKQALGPVSWIKCEPDEQDAVGKDALPSFVT
ncbi:hypothetical protein [Nonomuraea sp. NPDC049695]|uniref:hypothetical protein n=1 Tax=Nonomuraea sp. NPDC049695 TaxID=3154734 RepID=UPI0034428973